MSATAVRIDATPVDDATAASFEAVELRAWADLYAAAPAKYAAEAGVSTRLVGGGLAVSWAATGRRYFSRAIALGVLEPASEAAVDEIIRGYEEQGISKFLFVAQPHCRPAAYERWLLDRGLEPFDAHDRVVRGAEPLGQTHSANPELDVARVTRETAEEWSDFIQHVYRLDTGTWLVELVDRPGWHHYTARENGELVGARSMCIGPEGRAWLGIDGPVPGVMTPDHAPDAAIMAFAVAEGLERGARLFVTDIEAPSPNLDLPIYDAYAQIGFRRPYTRTHYARLRP